MTRQFLTHPETGLTTAGRHATSRFFILHGAVEPRRRSRSNLRAFDRRFAGSLRSIGQRHFRLFTPSRRVIKLLRCEIAGAARITTGSMMIHASAQDLTQCPKKSAAQGKLRLATAAAIALVRADWMAAKRKCA
jgi:hypothetical protein